MFDYTKAAVEKTVNDCKLFAHIYNIAVQLLYILYLIYAIAAHAGILWVNIALLTASSLYFIFYIFMHKMNSRMHKDIKSVARRTYQYFKLSMRALTLGTMIYGIYIATTHVTPLSVILAALAVVGWTLQVIFEIALYFIESHAKLIMAGVEADKESLTKPVRAVGDLVRKITGKESLPEGKPSKFRRLLDSQVSRKKKEKQKKNEDNESVVIK